MKDSFKNNGEHNKIRSQDLPLTYPGDKGFKTLEDVNFPSLEKYELEVSEKLKTNPSVYVKILDDNAKLILELIINGWSYVKIAEKLGVPLTSFYAWKRDSAYAEVLSLAAEESADIYAQKSIEVLLDPAGEKEIADVTRRKALSDAYKWMASHRNKHRYGKNNTSTNINVNVGKVDDDKSFNDLLSMVVKKNQSQQQIPNNNRISDAEYSE